MRRSLALVAVLGVGVAIGWVANDSPQRDAPVEIIVTRLNPEDGRSSLVKMRPLFSVTDDRPSTKRTYLHPADGDARPRWRVEMTYPKGRVALYTISD